MYSVYFNSEMKTKACSTRYFKYFFFRYCVTVISFTLSIVLNAKMTRGEGKVK